MTTASFGHTQIYGGGLYMVRDFRSGNPNIVNILKDSTVENGSRKGQPLVGGAFMSPELSFDGKEILFAYARPAYADKKRVWEYTEKASMGGVKDLAYLPDHQMAVVGQLQGQVTLFDGLSAGFVRFSQLFPADIHSVALSPDGKWIAACVSNGRICLMPTEIPNGGAGFLESESARRRRMRIWKPHSKKVEQLFF